MEIFVSELNSNSNEYSSLNDERILLRVYLFLYIIHFSHKFKSKYVKKINFGHQQQQPLLVYSNMPQNWPYWFIWQLEMYFLLLTSITGWPLLWYTVHTPGDRRLVAILNNIVKHLLRRQIYRLGCVADTASQGTN